MHMANELLSVPVASVTCGGAAVALGLICNKAKKMITSDKLALMGLLGAFVFAAQMVNFQLPLMPGTSGHLVGAVLLAIVLGPTLGAIAISSVVIIQCLIFQDGGLLALGCNILNMAIVPSYLGYYVYTLVTGGSRKPAKIYLASVIAAIAAMVAGAILVPIQAAFSGVLVVPFMTFLTTMIGVHLIIGVIEGLITAAALVYLTQSRPDLTVINIDAKPKLSKPAFYSATIIITIIIAAGISLLASGNPDGLEWSYLERPDQPEFSSMIENDSPVIEKTDQLHSKYAPMPDYTKRQSKLASLPEDQEQTAAAGWTSFAGVVGAAVTMLFIWAVSLLIKKKEIKTA